MTFIPEHHGFVSDVEQFSQDPPTDFQSAFLRHRGHQVVIDIHFGSSWRRGDLGLNFSDLLNNFEELLGVIDPQGGGLQGHHEDHKDKQRQE